MVLKISKKVKFLAVFLAGVLLAGNSFTALKVNAATQVTVYSNYNVKAGYFQGLGAQFDPYIGSDKLVDALGDKWDTVLTRVNFMEMGFARVCIATNAFCPTRVVGSYNWNTAEMQQLYKILDNCKQNGTTVFLSSWRKDYFNDTIANNESEDYSTMMVDCLEYLIKTKGYTNIKYYQQMNEPKDAKISWSGYKTNYSRLQAKIAAKGLSVKLSGTGNQPGSTANYDLAHQAELQPYVGAYDIHYYPWQSVTKGGADTLIKDRILGLSTTNPFFITEAGSLTGQDANDNQAAIGNHWYALHNADLAIQAIQQGCNGLSMWEIDSAQHGRSWGMWDIFNHPDPYPWFYTYSLMSKYFKPGMVFYNPSAIDSETRLLVGQKKVSANVNYWTIAVVNRGTSSKDINVRIPGVGTGSFNVYKYTSTYHPVDSNSLPVADSSVNNVAIGSNGVSFTVPADGFILLTTYGKGTVSGNPTVTNYFTDDFEDGDSAGWTTGGGTWSVITDGSKVFKLNGSTDSIATAGNTLTDFTYAAKSKILTANGNAGLVFRYTDSNNYYTFRMNDSTNKAELYKRVGGTMTLLASSSVISVDTNTWYNIKVIIAGNNIRAYVDGYPLINWTNSVNQLTSGKIGLRSTCDAEFDDVVAKN